MGVKMDSFLDQHVDTIMEMIVSGSKLQKVNITEVLLCLQLFINYFLPSYFLLHVLGI